MLYTVMTVGPAHQMYQPIDIDAESLGPPSFLVTVRKFSFKRVVTGLTARGK